MNIKRQPLKPHWYYITVHYCPLCGREETFRERRFDPRPEDWKDRHEFLERWDYCGAL